MLSTPRIGSADPFWVQMRAAIDRQAHQCGAELVEIDLDFTAARTPDEQRALVEALTGYGVQALVCAFMPEMLAYRVLDAGLPIVHLTESSVRHARFAAPQGYYDIARSIGGYLMSRLGGRGELLVVGGLTAGRGEDGRSRLAGILDALRDFPAVRVSHVPSAWRYEHAYPQVEAALQKLRGPFDALFGLSDSLALAARDAAQAAGALRTGALVVGINGDPLALAAIADGSMAATVETPASDLAERALALALGAAEGQALPTRFSFTTRFVDHANVAEVAMHKLIAIADMPSRLVGYNPRRDRQLVTQLEARCATLSEALSGAVAELHEVQGELREIAAARAADGDDRQPIERLLASVGRLGRLAEALAASDGRSARPAAPDQEPAPDEAAALPAEEPGGEPDVLGPRRALDAAGGLARPTSPLVKRAVAFIQQHHARDLSRHEIAEAIGISPNYLSQIFHRELGISPWEFLNRYRIKVAQELLRSTGATITDVAVQVGFSDPAYFSRVFRRQVGQSPRAFRSRG